MSMHSLSLLNPVFSYEIPGSARFLLPILPTLFINAPLTDHLGVCLLCQRGMMVTFYVR